MSVSLGVKRPERELNHPPPFSVEVMKTSSCTSASPILRGVVLTYVSRVAVVACARVNFCQYLLIDLFHF
jgi:hypothetical protein